MRALTRLTKASAFALTASWSVLAAAQTAPPLPSTGGRATAEAADDGLQDIIVTARQRSEGLIATPVSVTAIGGADLARTHTDTLAKVAEQIPNLIIGSTPGFGGGGSIGIRGISSAAGVTGFEQPVSVVIDGIPISNGWVTGPGMFDINRVEVLKGPQALLFGKNNTAGVIAISPISP